MENILCGIFSINDIIMQSMCKNEFPKKTTLALSNSPLNEVHVYFLITNTKLCNDKLGSVCKIVVKNLNIKINLKKKTMSTEIVYAQ